MIPGAGHMVQLEASDEVNAILLDYLLDIQQWAWPNKVRSAHPTGLRTDRM